MIESRNRKCYLDGFTLLYLVTNLMLFAHVFVLLQLELEQQKIEEEQENTPEFVKMKSNLRRTKQETDGEERTT